MRKAAAFFGAAGGALGLLGLVLAVYFGRTVVTVALVSLGVLDLQEASVEVWDSLALAAYLSNWPTLLCAVMSLAGAVVVSRRPLMAVALFVLSGAGFAVTLAWFGVAALAMLSAAVTWAASSGSESPSRTVAASEPLGQQFTAESGHYRPVPVAARPE